ncbi:zinc finger CCCH domain-containing protein 14-like [Rutidosis leptorrhynchoides]|uniref:zinc finger CCCH domain-containing protein 14-like n=1 Tax=Rutidosis leptorrhynchoides TaxID=125765 RepID=UPI003A993FDF
MEFAGARKRDRTSSGFNGNPGFKKSKQETDSFQSGLGSKSKPCTKFFSTSGCPFGEGCHFAHYVPGGAKALTQMTGPNQSLPPTIRTPVVPPSFPDGSSPPSVKSRLCTKYNTAEGCRFGDSCHYAHGEWELGKPTVQSRHEDPRMTGPAAGNRFGGPGRMDFNPSSNQAAAAGFGASATAKISVNGTLAGPIIGKNGVNSKQICRLTGVKLSIRDHESDPNLKNIELEGTFDQIKQASQMVRELIVNISSTSAPQMGFGKPAGGFGGPAGTFKTKLCDNFSKGSCTFGDRCHFAHGAEELRSSGA